MDYLAYQTALREHFPAPALPFPDTEYRQRLERLRAAMAAQGLDALLATDAADIFYLCGYNTFEVSVHTCLVVRTDRLVLQVPSIETGPAVTGSRVDTVLGYRWEQPGAVIGQLVESLGPDVRRVGLDRWSPTLRSAVDRALTQALPDAEFVDASGLVDRLRIVKSEAELAMLRESARITALGIEAAAAAVAPGVTDSAIAAAGARALHEAGSEFMSMQPIVVAGRRSSVIHMNHQRHAVAAGDPVFLEFGAVWQRYTAPMMHTRVAGTPTGEMKTVLATIRRIHETLLEALRPGRTFHDAAVAAEQALALLAERVFFSGVYGYAVGAQFPPSWVEGSGYIARDLHVPFEAGMVFHLPLCLRIPGQWGIGMSETVQVTAVGGEPLAANRWSLTAAG